MTRLIQWILLGCVAISAFLPWSIETLASTAFFLIVALFLLTFSERKMTLLSSFTFAFAYMIPPEAILFASALSTKWGAGHVLVGYRVLMLSFIAVNVGFLLFRKHSTSQNERKDLVISPFSNLTHAKIVFSALTLFLVLLFSPMIAYGLTTGRGSSSLYNPESEGGLLFNVGILGYFLFALLYAVCGFWGYYFSRERKGRISFIKAALYSSPIFLIGIASGTRYVLCFMLVSTFLPWVYRLNLKKLKWIAIGGLFLALLFSAMKNSRYDGFDFSAGLKSEESTGTLTELIVSKGSPEGLLRNMAMIDLWTTTHSHTHGKSIGFLGFFWIPRAIWHEKPTQIDHWLIREYESGFNGGYSTASSFCGELFMDFGYGCILICVLLGILMAKLDLYIERNLLVGGFFPTAMAGIIFGWAFFMTRSFLTATYPLFLGLPIVWLLAKYVIKENKQPTPIPPPEMRGRLNNKALRSRKNQYSSRSSVETRTSAPKKSEVPHDSTETDSSVAASFDGNGHTETARIAKFSHRNHGV